MRKGGFLANRQEMVGTCFGKENELRKLMLLLGLLAAMMLVASPVLAWQPGPGEGNKYSNYYGDKKASNTKWCNTYYTEYQKKTFDGKKWYWVHVYYWWKTPDGKSHKWNDWYYCQYHKYNDPDSSHPYFNAWVTYKPTGNHYWEWFYWHS